MTLLRTLSILLVLFKQMAACTTYAANAARAVVKPDAQLADTQMVAMVLLPAGPFAIGREDASADERATHRVFLTDCYIDRYEVTAADYVKFLKSEGVDPPVLWQEA